MDDILSQLKKPRNFIMLAIFAVGFLVIIPQLDSFKNALSSLNRGSLNFIIISIVFTFATYFFAALIYQSLSFKKLRYFRTVIVQTAAMFINRLLPAGIGAMGVNYLYLRKNKNTKIQAASVVAINNLLGGIGHNILFWVVVLWGGYSAVSAKKFTNPIGFLFFTALLSILVYFLYKFSTKFKKLFRDVIRQLRSYKKNPTKILKALLFSMCLTLCNVLALYFAAKAFNIDLSFAKTFIIFTIGVSGGAITPTPGGLGGFEAGLTAGYIAFGIDKEAALAAAILYRLISYWLTLIAGSIAFFVSLKQKWI